MPTSRWLPTYPGDAPDPRLHHDEAELWVRAIALLAMIRLGERPVETARLRPTDLIHQEVDAEIARVLPRGDASDMDTVREVALTVAAQIIAARTPEVNRRVIARAAVEYGYDLIVRRRVVSALAEPPPLFWKWGWGPDQWGRSAPRQLNSFRSRNNNYRPAIAGHDVSRLSRLPSHVDQAVKLGTVVDAGVSLTRTLCTYADVLRPPLAALKLAADIVAQLDLKPRNILALNLGHSFGPQALSGILPKSATVWWDGAPIYGHSFDERRAPAQADVVVASVPASRLVMFTLAEVTSDELITRQAIDGFERSTGGGGDHAPQMAAEAAERVRPGGLLVLLGDDEDGIHHGAIKALQPLVTAGVLAPVSLASGKASRNTVAKPIWCPAAERPWRPGGVLAPTGRLMSAWRRL